jgi:hypothetical protein
MSPTVRIEIIGDRVGKIDLLTTSREPELHTYNVFDVKVNDSLGLSVVERFDFL